MTDLRDLQTVMDAACARGGISGAALALHTGGEVQAVAAGLANAREDIAATPDTLFHIGSVTKAITAELVWRLILDGRLTADTPVIEAAPELAHITALTDRRLTIVHLLTHTGGLDGDIVFDAGRGADVLQRFLARIPSIGALAAPGERFSYANVGYNILARIVELHGGAPFQDALGRLLRDTYGLTRIAIQPEDKIRHRTALLTTRSGDGWITHPFGPFSNIGSGTVLAMSLTDLVRWGAALAGSGELAARMTAPAVALPFSHRFDGWGHGVILFDGLGEQVFGHDGGTAGTSTFLRIAPGAQSAWAFAATGAEGLAVFRELDPIIRDRLGLPQRANRRPTGAPPGDLMAYEGDYHRLGASLRLRAEGEGALVLSTEGVLDGLVLRPIDREVFEAEIPAMGRTTIWISFHEFDADGRPQLLFALERLARRGEAGPS